MPTCLCISVGPSFAELGLWSEKSSRPALSHSKTVYLPNQSLAAGLKDLLESASVPKDGQLKVLISSHHLTKILDSRLGGSVAQLITKGFETWHWVRQKPQQEYFDWLPSRSSPLATKDLIFGINERINHAGLLQTPVNESELEEIANKLNSQDIKKVCVNFLFSHKNDQNEQKTVRFFKEKGFEVFYPEIKSGTDEVMVWRRNVINACLMGSFIDFKNTITQGLQDWSTEEKIQFFFSPENIGSFYPNSIVDSLFAQLSLVQKSAPPKTLILNLDTEIWHLIKSNSQWTQWQSPWGAVQSLKPEELKLKIQPSSEVTSNEFGELIITEQELSFEPGPMLFGRAFRPMLFDFLQVAAPNADFKPFCTEIGERRLREHLQALIRNSKNSRGQTVEQIARTMLEDCIDQMASSLLLHTDPKDQIFVTGRWASSLGSMLKERWPKLNLSIDAQSRTSALQSMESLV